MGKMLLPGKHKMIKGSESEHSLKSSAKEIKYKN